MNIEEFHTLVKRFYDPTFSSQIKEIESQLQIYQRSPDGWQYANTALESSDQSLRFFGALTLWMKLKEDGLQLTKKQCEEVLLIILHWYIQLSLRDEAVLVKQKLCSALVALFVLPNSQWRNCIKHVAFCCTMGKVSLESSSRSHSIHDLLENLNQKMTFALLLFTKIFAEDLNQIDNESRRLDYIQKRVVENIEDASDIIRSQLAKLHEIPPRLASDILGCYRAWIVYASDTLQSSATEEDSLRDLIELPLACIFIEQVCEGIIDFFLEVVDEHFDFLTTRSKNAFLDLITDKRALDIVHALEIQEDDIVNDISLSFARLVLVFGQATITSILENPENPTLSLVQRITRSQNYMSFDKILAEEIVSFWDCYNTEASTSSVPSYSRASICWIQTIEEFCNMVKLPADLLGPGTSLVHSSKDSFRNHSLNLSTRDTSLAHSEFILFRTNRAVELIQDSYATYGVVVLEKLVSLLVLRDINWSEVEAVFTLLSGMSEFIPETSSIRDEEEIHLQKLFESPLFRAIINFESFVPLWTRKLVVKIIGEHHSFLGHHQHLLLDTLQFLFHFMITGSALDECSRAIYRLCDHNRKVLASKWEQLMEVSEMHFRSEASSQNSRGDILGANAAVISCLSSENQSIGAMHRLLSILEQRLQAAMITSSEDGANSQLLAGEEALDYLTTIGKAFQTPDDVPVDLDGGSEDSIWTSEEGMKVQNGIVQLLQLILRGNLNNGAFLEGACNVLKTGYPESIPGPFVFQPQVTIDLLTSAKFDNPMLYVAVDTASRFVSCHSSTKSRAYGAVTALIEWICKILEFFPHPRDDPEVAYSCVEFFSRCITKYLVDILTLPNQGVLMISDYTLNCLKGPDPLPKRAAAKYWGTLFKFDDSGQEDQRGEVVQLLKDHLLTAGPHLSTVLMNNFSGLAARSDLEALFEPLKGLVTSPITATYARAWLKQAFLDENAVNIPEERMSNATREKFIAQVIRLRGDRKTKSVIKEFWMACRGMA